MWPKGPICTHCGAIGHAYATKRERDPFAY
ncbi:MAG: hypothetical protein CL533_23955 [Afipia sp.]|nr:hypothetical protein [Afipia sp.]OUX58856.1 MAG: hypothetical protein CBB64_23900 [Afipia sp. TMED4]